MRIKILAAIFLLVALTISVSQTAAEQAEPDVVTIQALVAAWGTAIEAGDVAGVVAVYTDDVVQMPPDAPANKGKQAVEVVYRGILEAMSVGVTWPVEGTEEIIVADGWAIYLSEYIESFTPKAGGETIEEHGKIIEICQKQPDGSWRFAREIWNRNSPNGKE